MEKIVLLFYLSFTHYKHFDILALNTFFSLISLSIHTQHTYTQNNFFFFPGQSEGSCREFRSGQAPSLFTSLYCLLKPTTG